MNKTNQTNLNDTFKQYSDFFKELKITSAQIKEFHESNTIYERLALLLLILFNQFAKKEKNFFLLWELCSTSSARTNLSFKNYTLFLKKQLNSTQFQDLVLFFLNSFFTIVKMNTLLEYKIPESLKDTLNTNKGLMETYFMDSLPAKVDSCCPSFLQLCPLIHNITNPYLIALKKIQYLAKPPNEMMAQLETEYDQFISRFSEEHEICVEHIAKLDQDNFESFFSEVTKLYYGINKDNDTNHIGGDDKYLMNLKKKYQNDFPLRKAPNKVNKWTGRHATIKIINRLCDYLQYEKKDYSLDKALQILSQLLYEIKESNSLLYTYIKQIITQLYPKCPVGDTVENRYEFDRNDLNNNDTELTKAHNYCLYATLKILIKVFTTKDNKIQSPSLRITESELQPKVTKIFPEFCDNLFNLIFPIDSTFCIDEFLAFCPLLFRGKTRRILNTITLSPSTFSNIYIQGILRPNKTCDLINYVNDFFILKSIINSNYDLAKTKELLNRTSFNANSSLIHQLLEIIEPKHNQLEKKQEENSNQGNNQTTITQTISQNIADTKTITLNEINKILQTLTTQMNIIDESLEANNRKLIIELKEIKEKQKAKFKKRDKQLQALIVERSKQLKAESKRLEQCEKLLKSNQTMIFHKIQFDGKENSNTLQGTQLKDKLILAILFFTSQFFTLDYSTQTIKQLNDKLEQYKYRQEYVQLVTIFNRIKNRFYLEAHPKENGCYNLYELLSSIDPMPEKSILDLVKTICDIPEFEQFTNSDLSDCLVFNEEQFKRFNEKYEGIRNQQKQAAMMKKK